MLWERAMTWLVLGLVIFLTIVPQLFIIVSNWTIAVDGYRNGTIPLLSLAMPIILLVAAVLLVRLNKWCLPLFILHFVGSFISIAYYYGLAAINWQFCLGYIIEIAVIGLSLRLFGRKVLK